MDKLKKQEYYCDYCETTEATEYDEENVWWVCDIRPFDVFCCGSCLDAHIESIERGDWHDHDGDNKGLEVYYKDEIKTNWIGYPYRLISADSNELIKQGKIGEVVQ